MTSQLLPFDDRESQTAAILSALQAGRKLTPLNALNEFGCFRLGARVWDLKKQGFDVKTVMVKTPSGKRVAEYSL